MKERGREEFGMKGEGDKRKEERESERKRVAHSLNFQLNRLPYFIDGADISIYIHFLLCSTDAFDRHLSITLLAEGTLIAYVFSYKRVLTSAFKM